MTTREFAAKLFTEHFIDKSINHLHSGWGHNFNSEFKDRRDNTYAAISLILKYWDADKENTGIGRLIAWLQEPSLTTPWNVCSTLAWNLYYSLTKDQTEHELRCFDKKRDMYSLLRSIEINGQLSLLTEDQQKRLTDITSFIMNKTN